jgi:uncharacterized protein (TIGR04141 family)
VWDLLYSINNEYHLIHIKKYRCSATLSHLFAQGKVSHEALKRDENYFNYLRDSFTTWFPEWVWPADKDDIKTVFGIITTKHSLNELPFFSKINLINTVDNISKLNWVVKFVFIPIS